MSDTHDFLYRRVLLKLSGEALSGGTDAAIDPDTVHHLAEDIAFLLQHHIEVAIVVGGGNFLRGADLSIPGITRPTADQMAMLSTIINGLAIRDIFTHHQITTTLFSAIPVNGIAPTFDRYQANQALKRGEVVLFVGGTGNPLVTTDTTASLRGIEMDADVLLKGSQVDGIYDKDPSEYPDAKRYTSLSFDQALQEELAVMDLGAFIQCREHALPIRVFDIGVPHILRAVMTDPTIGTFVYQ
jgi:uridylate kinase